MFKKILIANRGEIALRIIRTCREMGIRSVVVYSEADADSLPVHFADEAICIGPAKSAESYLYVPNIISAAMITDSEAIHPGYGFLAENADFVDVCTDHGISFIGPTADQIRQMGDKATARQTAKKAGVPVVPGSEGIIKDEEQAIKLVKKMGYPVIIKAVAGGGGKGMRVAHTESSLVHNLRMAMHEAEKAFNNGDVYIERYIERPRHIEMQILGDNRGNVIHLGERDCTVQRRYQKLIEESPSPIITSRMRKNIGDAAIKLAKAIKYVGAGTVEFLFDEKKRFYFMEMNTRIQVEHTVTEEVSGMDLIRKQIEVAAGMPLGMSQKSVKLEGHAIECRINAEDPDQDFRPNPGKIEVFNLPGGHGVRVDTHCLPEYTIPPYYDSMLAKLVTTGKNRSEAISRMRRALEEFIVKGVPTTIPFHLEVMNNQTFLSGDYATDFVTKMGK